MSSADRPSELYQAWLHTAPAQYFFAILAVATAAFARYGLDRVLGPTHAFILFYPTIFVVALLTGFYPALLATLLSAAIGDYFFMAPLYSFKIGDFRDSITNLVFVFVGLSMAAVAHVIRARTARLKEFERAVEGTEEMVAVIDRNCRYLIANRAFLAYRGMKREELLGRRVADVLNPGVFENALKDKIDECFRGRTVEFEMVYPYAMRGERELLITYFPIQGRHRIDRIACVLQDITDRRASERSVRLFRTLVDHSNDAVEVIDPVTLRFLDVNETSSRDLGYTKQELLGTTMCEVTSGCDHMGCAGLLVELKAKKTLLKQMTRRRKNGDKFPVEVSLNYVELDRPYILAVSRDISERIEAERALRDSEDRYRDLVENSEDLVCTHDLQGKLLSVNPAPARILGYSVDELLSMPMMELIAPEFRSQFELYLDRVRNNGADEGILCVVTRSGQERIWEYRNTLRTEGVAQPVVRGMAHDITEQTLAEQALRGREEDYRQFVAQSSEGIFREDLDAPLSVDLPEDELVEHILHDSYVAECNDAMAKMYGFDTSRQLTGKRLTNMLMAGDPRNLEMTREYIRSGFRLVDRESHEIDLHGKPRVFRNSLIGIVENGKLLRTWGIQRDVTEQAQLEQARAQAGTALRKSEEHFRMLVEQATDGIFVADSQGRYIDVNTAGAQMLGYSREEIIGLGITDVIAESEIARLSSETARFAGGAVVRSEWTMRRKDGSLFPAELCGRQLPDGRLQGILRDMSDRKNAEEELRQSEERFRVALNHSPITVFNQDRHLRYTWIYNPQLYWQDEVIGKTDEEVLGAKKAAGLMSLKRRVLDTGSPVREEVLVRNNGTRFALDMSLEPLLDSERNVVGITGACIDIARLRELADRLQDSKDQLEQQKSLLEKEIRTELGFADIIGESPQLEEVLKKVRIVAPTDTTVLLLGETGTGKELIARSLHALSARRDKSFVKLNCAAVPSGLLESELFGHEKGAFTGAVSQKVGRIELADKGTLFLDEIGDLPLELQPKLLRVLQDREFERLGSVRTLHVDVRIIYATNRDLRQDVAEKKFREDLYYRLNVFPIHLPPLRERKQDIPILVRYFVEKHAVRMGKQWTQFRARPCRSLRTGIGQGIFVSWKT